MHICCSCHAVLKLPRFKTETASEARGVGHKCIMHPVQSPLLLLLLLLWVCFATAAAWRAACCLALAAQNVPQASALPCRKAIL